MNSLLLSVLAIQSYLVVVGILLVNGACVRDNYANPPAVPNYPTATVVNGVTGVLVENHWSEIVQPYRPQDEDFDSVPYTSCPHLESGLDDWHDASIWPGSIIPTTGDFTLPANKKILLSSCSVDSNTVHGYITVPSTSQLIFGDGAITFRTKGIIVDGALRAGSSTCKLRRKVDLILHGSRGAQTVQSLATTPWVKGIVVNGQIEIHANTYTGWTRLARSALKNDTTILIQDKVNWQPGQKIVITTTELKDSRDFHRNELVTILSVKKTNVGKVHAVELTQPLAYNHYGGKEYQAEVGLISRDFVIQGDETNSIPTDVLQAVCNGSNVTQSGPSTYPCPNRYLTGFGGHIIIRPPAQVAKFSGVQLYRMGQTNVLGRYPIHYHLLNSTLPDAYVESSSIQESFFRAIAIHATNNVRVSKNVVYDCIGHAYFLEDGVEEGNLFEYNFGAYIHPLGDVAKHSHEGLFGSQQLNIVNESVNLVLPSDISAAVFYVTNSNNSFIGNAASGGFAGFSFPNLQTPIKESKPIPMVPKDKPLTVFRGNSAHSSSFWYGSAGNIYFGGLLFLYPDGVLAYDPGRGSIQRATKIGNQDSWMRLEDTKVFLSNGRGIQHWGQRAEIVRVESHDTNLLMNVFGEVLIMDFLHQCRSVNPFITYFNGCPRARGNNTLFSWSLEGQCNTRDFQFFRGFTGFQFYDVGQRHILKKGTFRNCNNNWKGTGYSSYDGRIFTLLTHSDEFVPDQMQATIGMKYENCNTTLWEFSTQLDVNNPKTRTVSGKLQNWLDVDGSVFSATGPTCRVTNLGSTWAGDWWKINPTCREKNEMYSCELYKGDRMASIYLAYDPVAQSGIGNSNCPNGGGAVTCPVIASAYHFGNVKGQQLPLEIGVNAKVSGIYSEHKGGWMIEFVSGTPKILDLSGFQLSHESKFVVAIPYKTGSTFKVYAFAASWCNVAWGRACNHTFVSANSVAEVRNGFGDLYYFSPTDQLLYVKLFRPLDEGRTGPAGSENVPYTSLPSYTPNFTRESISLFDVTYGYRVNIVASNCGSGVNCDIVNVPVPPALSSVGEVQTQSTCLPGFSSSAGVKDINVFVVLLALIVVVLRDNL